MNSANQWPSRELLLVENELAKVDRTLCHTVIHLLVSSLQKAVPPTAGRKTLLEEVRRRISR